MGKYLKKFSTDSERVEYEGSNDYLEPYVSLVESDYTVHYNKPPETRVVTKYNVTSTSSPTIIGGGRYITAFTEIEIDGVVQPRLVSAYTFNTVGEHTIKYTLADTTKIGTGAFSGCSDLTCMVIPNSVTSVTQSSISYCSSLSSVTIPNSVTSIGSFAFKGCSSLTSVIIPTSVTQILSNSFADCSGLTNLTSLATTAPTIKNNTFEDVKANGTLCVPIGSSGYDTWMSTSNYYLGLYGWTKVEQ